MTKVLMVASEARPFAMTGGLGDVVGALPAALHETGCEVAVLLPRYSSIPPASLKRVYDDLPIWLGGAHYPASVYRMGESVPFYFLDCPGLYDREGLYGTSRGDYPDNHIRFAVLCRAALEVARRIFRPEVIHCHDWQAALTSVYLGTAFAGDPTFAGMKTLLTVHNLGYQGLFPREALSAIGLDDALFHPGALEFFGKVNLLKGGLVYSDALSTVSKGYAREIQTEEYGWGLDGLLRERAADLTGILNGVDYSTWNPETDRYLQTNYAGENLSGKFRCKQALAKEFGFAPDGAGARPLIGVISRLVDQKGTDLLVEIADELVKEDMWLVALGSGEKKYEKALSDLARAHPTKIGVRIGYDDRLAHRIEAGADLFLMPSRYEPCGLNQIYSLRYGTIPVVRATGGLDDTIDEETGFKFEDYSGAALLGAIRTALKEFGRKEKWQSRMRRAMNRDFSWKVSAREYVKLYKDLIGKG